MSKPDNWLKPLFMIANLMVLGNVPYVKLYKNIEVVAHHDEDGVTINFNIRLVRAAPIERIPVTITIAKEESCTVKS
jgi:hypothetical protein